MKDKLIEQVKSFGEFNDWKGYVDQYFNTKMQREFKKLGVKHDTKISDAYAVLTSNK